MIYNKRKEKSDYLYMITLDTLMLYRISGKFTSYFHMQLSVLDKENKYLELKDEK